MSCAGSERIESNKGFDCRNMGDVLGKECEKEESLTCSVEDVLREEVEGAASSGGSESESDKDFSMDSNEDLSWLLPVNPVDLGAAKCNCEACLKLFESYSTDKNTKLLLSSWKEFRNYIRNVYLKSPFEFTQKNESVSLKNNKKLHEIIQVMRLCDPYQLFQKIEDELCSMVLESRIRQLNLLKDESNPALAEEFITGLIAEYVKLLTSALQLSPAIENLLGPHLQKFGLTWEVLNKQLYRSIVYNHFDVQQNLVRFIEQLRKMLPFKDDIYHELVHQYLALDREMTLLGSMWKNVEPPIQEYRNLKSKENEKLNSFLDAMKDFFANKLGSSEEDLESQDKNPSTTSEDALQYCPNCMTRRDCSCDECTVTHMMSCEDILLGIESPLGTNSPSRSRSRSPIKQNETDDKENSSESQRDSPITCQCYVCEAPPSDLMDCSVTFDQSRTKNLNPGSGTFQFDPHIQGSAQEGECVSNVYSNVKKYSDFFYPHLYNLHNQKNTIADSQTSPLNNMMRTQLMSPIVSSNLGSQPETTVSSPAPLPSLPQERQSTSVEHITSSSIVIPKISNNKSGVNAVPEKLQQLTEIKKQPEQNGSFEPMKENNCKSDNICAETLERKNNDVNRVFHRAEKETKSDTKPALEKAQNKSSANARTNGCVISGICGKCCLKHGPYCLKMPGCGSEKNSSASRPVSQTATSRVPMRCTGSKDDHGHRSIKSHLCGKSKQQENLKRAGNKKGSEGEDCLNHENSCSEVSNSTSASVLKDPRHCDCCYCEVFGHGVPSVAPVSRNYQEMRERLRLRLSMKRSAKSKAGSQVPQQGSQKTAAGNSVSDTNSASAQGTKKEVPQDLESLLKYIEGDKKSECKDAKKAAKKARQKLKKQKEKERLMEEEEEEEDEEEEDKNKRFQTVDNQVTISLINNTTNNNGKRSQHTKVNPSLTKQQSRPQQQQQQQQYQPQTLNLSGLKSLVEKSDPNSVPKMVTIRRVMAPFSAEPTVTITLKGSTPDKDKVLFMLKNGSEAPPEMNQPSKKSKKKKEKQESSFNEVYTPAFETPVQTTSKKSKKKKQLEEELSVAESVSKQARTSKSKPTVEENTNSKGKSKNSKNGPEQTVNKSGKSNLATSSKNVGDKSATKKTAKTGNTNSEVLNAKSNSQKNASSTKNQNVKVKESVSKQVNKNDGKTAKNSAKDCSCKKSKSSNNSDSCANNSKSSQTKTDKKSKTNNNNNNVKNSVSDVQKGNQKNQIGGSASGQKSKKDKSQCVSEIDSSSGVNQGKKQKKESTEQNSLKNKKESKPNSGASKPIQNNSNKYVDIWQHLQNQQRLPNLEISRAQDVNEKNKKNKGNVKASMQDVEVNWIGPSDKFNDKGKVVINTPSYRLSEVLSSIAPSPPPKEEINLENLRLPPGITITKIEGPIAKPVKPAPVQQSQISKPAPPIVMSTPVNIKPNPPPGNVIVVDTGRLKDVIKENTHLSAPIPATISSKKKKKKNKQQAESLTTTVDVNEARYGAKVPKNYSPLTKAPLSILSGMDARKMVPNLENQQATIIKTSNNMVTIRSPALQQAMNIHAYQGNHPYKAGINGYSNMNLFNDEVTRINEKMGNLKLAARDSEDRLTRQMKSLNLKGGNKSKEEVVQVIRSSSPQSSETETKKKKKKKKKKKGKSGDEVEPVESVFQPKDIDLENGDIDDDERELEAFKRFCFQSVPPERKNKMKVNLNIKDIVLKKKLSGLGCS